MYRSNPPEPFTRFSRFEAKTIVRPLAERLGCISLTLVFNAAPTLTGADHGSFVLRRVEVQMSNPRLAVPTRRLDEKNSSLPSLRIVTCWSFDVRRLSSETKTAGPRVSPSRDTDA